MSTKKHTIKIKSVWFTRTESFVEWFHNETSQVMGRMHSDAQFAGSSSVPAHVEMMGFLGMGNKPMVGATVAIAVAIQQAMN